jgi:uncharacterized protein YrrD
MARYEHVKGLPVVTMAEGKKIGKVDDVLIDPDGKGVAWLRLHSGGILGGDRWWVPARAMHGIGEDAVTITSEADVLAPADAPEAEDLVRLKRTIIGNKVVTESGEHLGEVRDYEFAPDTFALTYLFVPPSMSLFGEFLTISADKVLTIGEDAIVVSAGAVQSAEPAGATGGRAGQ